MTDTSRWSAANLRVFSEQLTAAEIAERLETPSANSHEKGDPVSLSNPNRSKYRTAGWFFSGTSDKSLALEERLELIATFIEVKSAVLVELMDVCTVDIFCGFCSEHGHGGFTLSAGLLKRLTVIPIDVGFDLYRLDDEDVDP